MLHLRKLFRKKRVHPSVKTEMIDQTYIKENTGESEILLRIKHELNEMLKSPCYTEFRNFISNHMRSISEGAYVADELGSFDSVEEYVQSLYYECVVTILIYGYQKYVESYNVDYTPFGSWDLYLLQSLALEREDLSKGNIVDIVDLNPDTDCETYFSCSLVPLCQRFDRFREMEREDDRHTALMDAYYERKRTVSVLHPRKDIVIPIARELGIGDAYQTFIDANKDLIREIQESLEEKELAHPMELGEIITEMYDMIIIDHLLRVADYNSVIKLTYENRLKYTVEMLDICLPMNLCWMPNDRSEKEILDKFRKRVIGMNTKKGISKEFKDRVFDKAFGESRKYISSIEEILTDKIYENGVNINGNIENNSTVEKAVADIKEYMMNLMDESDIGVMKMCCRYADNGIPAVDVIAEEIDPWDLILHVSLPVFEKSGSISDPEELHVVLIKQLDEYEAEYTKKKYGSIKNLANDDWDPIEKEWDEFRGTGLFLIVNQFLHIFGWALVYNTETKQVKPARVRYRGFSEGSVTRAYEKVQRYMIENAQELYDESDYNDQNE